MEKLQRLSANPDWACRTISVLAVIEIVRRGVLVHHIRARFNHRPRFAVIRRLHRPGHGVIVIQHRHEVVAGQRLCSRLQPEFEPKMRGGVFWIDLGRRQVCEVVQVLVEVRAETLRHLPDTLPVRHARLQGQVGGGVVVPSHPSLGERRRRSHIAQSRKTRRGIFAVRAEKPETPDMKRLRAVVDLGERPAPVLLRESVFREHNRPVRHVQVAPNRAGIVGRRAPLARLHEHAAVGRFKRKSLQSRLAGDGHDTTICDQRGASRAEEVRDHAVRRDADDAFQHVQRRDVRR